MVTWPNRAVYTSWHFGATLLDGAIFGSHFQILPPHRLPIPVSLIYTLIPHTETHQSQTLFMLYVWHIV